MASAKHVMTQVRRSSFDEYDMGKRMDISICSDPLLCWHSFVFWQMLTYNG